MGKFENPHFTRYQLLVIFGVVMYSYPMFATNQLFSIFAKVPPSWSCGVTLNDTNSTSLKTAKEISCDILKRCPKENLTVTTQFGSLVTEFMLVCDQAYVEPLIATIQMAGLMTGSVVFGQFSDYYGRKPTMMIGYTGLLVNSILSTVMPSWKAVAVFRFFTGFFIGACIIATTTLTMEILHPDQRMFYRGVVCFWAGGRLIYTLVAYLTNYWRHTFLTVNCLTIPVLFIIYFGVQESPRWLLQHHKIAQAKKVLQTVARINGHTVSSHEFDSLETVASSNRRYTYLSIFSTPELRKRSFMVAVMYFSIACVSFGMDLKTGNLAGNLYINQVLIGVCLLISKPGVYIFDTLIPGFNRRILHQSTMGGAFVCLLIVAIISAVPMRVDVRIPLVAVFSILGVVILEWHWDAIYLYAPELFPTVVRSLGFSFSAVIGRIGNTLAPQINFLSDLWQPASYVVFMSVAFVDIVLSCLLAPETKGRELPDTLNLQTMNVDVYEEKIPRKITKVEDGAKMNGADVALVTGPTDT